MITDLNFICIYIMINNFTGQLYIGKTVNFLKRINEHFKGKGAENQRIDRATLKYGREAFTFKPLEIFEENDEDLINEREKYWIAKYDTFKNDFHYNLTPGGDGAAAGENHHNYRHDIDTNVLVDEYFDNGLSIYEISDKYNIPYQTVHRRILSTGCKLRSLSEVKFGENNPNYRDDIDTNVLVDEYFDNGLSINEIADKYNIVQATVYRRIISTGRKLRNLSEVKSGEKNYAWKDYARIIKACFKKGKQSYALIFNGERIKYSIDPDKLLNWFLENYPLEIIKVSKEVI